MRRDPDRASGTGRRVAATVAGALLVAASLVPATAAEAGTTTTVHGTVQSGTTRLAGVPVGFWSRTGHKLAGATTGATGAFTLHVPSGVRGFAYAGVRPDAKRAIFSLSGASFVRGVIGATQGATTSYRLYQGHPSATAAGLAGGGALRFRLQKPGRVRVVGGRPFTDIGAGEGGIGVYRLNGGIVGEAPAGARTGTAVSQLLVPGTYRIRFIPNPPYLRRSVQAVVAPGATTTLHPALTRGATVHGRLTGPGGEPAAGVPVTAVKGASSATEVTDADGRYAIPALAAGDYRLRIGYWPQPDPEAAGDMTDDQFKPPTSDDWLPRTRTFTVDAGHHDVPENATLAKAGHVRGTIAGATDSTRVWLESSTGRFVRTGAVTGGTYALGGLVPGTAYRLYAVTASSGVEAGRYGGGGLTATSGMRTKDIALTRTTLTLKGSIAGAPADFVIVRSAGSLLPSLDRRFQSDTGARSYTVRGLIPGRYAATIQRSRDPLSSRPAPLVLTTSPSTVVKDWPAAPRSGVYTVRFVSGAAPVVNLAITAVDPAGDVASIFTDLHGRSTDAVRAGTYRYVRSSFADAAPAMDGPWWFGAVSRTFTVAPGRTTDDGTIAVHVHATL